MESRGSQLGRGRPSRPSRKTLSRKVRSQGTAYPSDFRPTIVCPAKFRFACAAGTAYAGALALTRAHVLDMLNLVTAGSGSASRLFQAVKVTSVELWGMTNPTGGGAAQDIGVEWTSAYGPAAIREQICMGNAKPAHVFSRPPPKSLAGFWSLSGTNETEILGYIWSPTATLMEISVVGQIISDNVADTTSVAPAAGANFGSIAVKAPVGTSTWIPVATNPD